MEELSDVPAHVDSWIMTVKAELVIDFMILNPGVETATIPPEADTEQILILSRVTQQEWSFRFVLQQILSLVSTINQRVGVIRSIRLTCPSCPSRSCCWWCQWGGGQDDDDSRFLCESLTRQVKQNQHESWYPPLPPQKTLEQVHCVLLDPCSQI